MIHDKTCPTRLLFLATDLSSAAEVFQPHHSANTIPDLSSTRSVTEKLVKNYWLHHCARMERRTKQHLPSDILPASDHRRIPQHSHDLGTNGHFVSLTGKTRAGQIKREATKKTSLPRKSGPNPSNCIKQKFRAYPQRNHCKALWIDRSDPSGAVERLKCGLHASLQAPDKAYYTPLLGRREGGRGLTTADLL